MAQTFNPEHVLMKDTFGQEVKFDGFSTELAKGLKTQSLVTQLGERVEMGNQYIKEVSGDVGELSDAYIVGEGEKIGTAIVENKPYRLETKKIAVILPATREALEYSWAKYFEDSYSLIVDKFAKVIDSGAFLGNYRGVEGANPFGTSVVEQATNEGNVLASDLTLDALFDAEAMPPNDPNAVFGHRSVERTLRGIVDDVSQERVFDRTNGQLNGLNYFKLALPNNDVYPEGTLILGDAKGIKYGLPQGSGLRMMVANQATLSKVQNAGPDAGDVHLFEQDSQAVRAIFEIAVAIPDGRKFAIVQPGEEAPEV